MPRQPRYLLPGFPQHVIQRGNNRQATFHEAADYERYIHELISAARQARCAIHCYVLMTNHTHLLVTPEHDHGISQMMQSLGRSYVGYINRKYDRTGTLWEGRYKASLVDSNEYLLCCYRYIELNPVRAGLVADPSEYPWSSYRHHALGQFDRVATQHEVYRSLGTDAASRERAYRSLVQGGLDDETLEQIRASTNADLVLGNEAFKDHIETVLNRPVRHKKSGRPRKTCL